MRKFITKTFSFTTLILFICVSLVYFVVDAIAEPSPKNHSDTLTVGVVGDTGIGERAYHPGFIAVAKALRKHHPDLDSSKGIDLSCLGSLIW